MNQYKNLRKTFFSIGIFRIFIIILNLLITAMLLNILGAEQYGVFVAVTSIFTWIIFFDLGLGKGMRNELTVTLCEKNVLRTKELISTTYLMIFILTVCFFLISILILEHIDFKAFLQIKSLDSKQIHYILELLIIFIFIKFFLSLIDQIFYASHKSELVTINVFMSNLLYIFGLCIMILVSSSSIEITAFIFGISMVLVYMGASLLYFVKNPSYFPSINFFNKELFFSVILKGYKILFIQFSAMLILGLDRLILLKYTGANDVTTYDIIYKIMTILLFPFSIIAQPLWSSYTEAFHKKDFTWIRSVYKKLYALTGILLMGVFILTYSFDWITHVLLDHVFVINAITIFLTGVLLLLLMWSTMHSDFLLGINQFKFQFISILMGLSAKFGYLYYCYTFDTLTLIDIIISGIIGYAFFCIASPIYIHRLIINLKARH